MVINNGPKDSNAEAALTNLYFNYVFTIQSDRDEEVIFLSLPSKKPQLNNIFGCGSPRKQEEEDKKNSYFNNNQKARVDKIHLL